MPDDIERVIYKLELDSSGYINGVESLFNSTKKLTAEQEKTNRALKQAEEALKQQAVYLQQSKKDLDNYSGSNEKYRQQLEKAFKSAQADNQKLNEVVLKNRQAYEQASKAAQDFANISAKASHVQQQTTVGKIPTGPGVTSGITSQIAGVLNVADFTKQALIIEQTKKEFDDLRISIGLAEARMKQLNATDEEFQQLVPIVAQGRKSIEQYDAATKGAVGSQLSLRSQLRQGREELVKLEQAGKGATKEYFALEKQIAKLTDEFGDQQARIKTLASDTKLLDFGKGAITAATSAFQVYTAVSILAGDENEELQKKTMQLFAAMQLLQSLEQLSNLTRREGVLGTLAMSGAQAAYAAVVGTSTGALKAFRLALAATGIGVAILLIGYLVSKWLDAKAAAEKAAEATKLFRDINKEAAKAVAEDAAKLEVFRLKLNDLTLTQSERIKFAKEYNEAADKTNQIDLKQLDNLTLINEQIDKQNKLIIQRAVSVAALSKLNEASNKFVETQLNLTTSLKSAGTTEEELTKKISAAAESQGAVREKQIKSLDSYTGNIQKNLKFQKEAGTVTSTILSKEEKDLGVLIQQRNNAKQALDDLAKELSLLISDIGVPKPVKDDAEKKIKEIQDDFEKKKAELDARLAALNAKESTDESKIRIEFASKLAKEQLEIERNKNLTKPQKIILNAELSVINKIELDKAVEDFRKKVTDARQKLNDELLALQDKNTENTINLIQDEFDRRAKLIEFNERKELADAKENTQKRLEALDLQRLLIGEDEYQKAKAIIISTGEQNALNIIQKFANQRKDEAAKVFKSILNAFDNAISISDLVSNEHEAKALQQAKQNFLTRKITYEEFQKEITRIQNDYNRERLATDLDIQKRQLANLEQHISEIIDTTSNEYADLIILRDKYRKDIASKEQEQAKDVNKPDDQKSRIDEVQQYAEAIGQVADAVIQFWRVANEAETKALDQSIALQEKRVSAAQRIAERGNAQYLKQEEDKLTELNVKRENAARKQLGIDTALQASQLLVGITGAIAKIGTGNVLETIASIAVIISTLATGYGLVKSLQGNQPQLATGSKYVSRGTYPAGTDTIPAMINEGEAVIPTHRNKAYHPTVEAIYDGTVPAEHLNNFVRNYHHIKGVPQPNYARIKHAAELHIGQDGRMSVLLSENNKKLDEHIDLQRATLRAMKNMSVSANIDKTGVAIMVNEYMEQMKIDSRI